MAYKTKRSARSNRTPLPRSIGGAAAIYGFVYQLTLSVSALLSAQFEQHDEHADPGTITAVLEPANGGDLDLEAAARTVVQFKHRRKALGAADLSDSVLPDLFRAHCRRPAEIYRLQTSHGLSARGWDLIAALQGRGENFHEGDADARVAISIKRLRLVYDSAGLPPSLFGTEVAAFLRKFEVAPAVTAEYARTHVLAFLRRRVTFASQVEIALDALVGGLVDQARHNDTEISIDDILGRLGLPGARRGSSSAARIRLRMAVEQALERREYLEALDVRAPIVLQPGEAVSAITGASGCGKSWLLYRLAAMLTEFGRPVVLIRGEDRAALERDLRKAIAVDALAQEQGYEVAALGQVWRRMQDAPDDEIVVLWEGCRAAGVIDEIHLAGGLGEGLVLVAEHPVADAAALRERAIPTHRVVPFTPAELFDALDRRGISAGEVPRAIRAMLRLPVLAGIYAKLATERAGWNPQNEYRVLEAFWDRGRGAGPLVGGRLEQLAGRLVATRRSSVVDAVMIELGFTEPELKRLIAEGWLTDEAGVWAFAHDRLLTWAIARQMAGALEAGTSTAVDLAAEVLALQARDPNAKPKAGLQGLGFLLMDVVWMIAERTGDALAFLDALKAGKDYDLTELYGALLPTVGPRILPVLESTAAKLAPDDYRALPALLAAFRAVDLSSRERAALLERLWSAARGVGNDLALALGEEWPLTAQRDRLWRACCALHPQRNEREVHTRITRMDKALERLVRDDPTWAVTLVNESTTAEERLLAGFLYRSLPGAVGAPLWPAVREAMLRITPDTRQHLLIDTIARFGSVEDDPVLEATVKGGGESAAAALRVLTLRRPNAALRLIEAENPPFDYPYDRAWLDALLDFDAQRTCKAVCTWQLVRDSSGEGLARFWSAAIDRIDSATVETLLDRLSAVVFDDEPAQGRAPGMHLLRILGDATLSPAHGPAFARWRSTRLSNSLKRRAVAHLDGVNDPDHDLVERTLHRIGGEEHRSVVLRRLSLKPVSALRRALIASLALPREAAIKALSARLENELDDESGALRLEIWRLLLAIDYAAWRPKLSALLESPDPLTAMIGLRLMPEYPERTDKAAIVACFKATTPESEVGQAAMEAVIHYGAPPASMERWARDRVNGAELSKATQVSLNILLLSRSVEARQVLDAYLGQFEAAKSWSSTDQQALAIRARDSDAPPSVLLGAEQMMHHTLFTSDTFIETVLKSNHSRAVDLLLDRAFSEPYVVTSAQPTAIKILAGVDKARATQAFVQSWHDRRDRRKHMVDVARHVDGEAIDAMIDSLVEEGSDGIFQSAFRAICVELRRDHERAWSRLLKCWSAADATQRLVLCPAMGWAARSDERLAAILAAEGDYEVRNELDGVRRKWRYAGEVVAHFRKAPSLAALEHLIEVCEPETLVYWKDPLRIVETVAEDNRMVILAERRLSQRYKTETGSSGTQNFTVWRDLRQARARQDWRSTSSRRKP